MFKFFVGVYPRQEPLRNRIGMDANLVAKALDLQTLVEETRIVSIWSRIQNEISGSYFLLSLPEGHFERGVDAMIDIVSQCDRISRVVGKIVQAYGTTKMLQIVLVFKS